jgi:hypothetical protein
MAGEDIRIANSVRQILGRHYIKPSSVRIMVGRGGVRVIGKLERTEAKAFMPIDEDYIHKLKNEIRRVPGVKTVSFTAPEEDTHAEGEKPGERKEPEESKENEEPEKDPRAGG